MTVRITVSVPEALVPDAQDLAMVLARGPEDANTYGALSWQDAEGNLYSCASFEAPPEWIIAAQGTLTRPAWDVLPYIISMAAANRAQDALVFWSGEGDIPQAAPGKMVAIAGMEGPEAVAAMGLTAITET
jgi:hypothetical protein